MSKLMTATVVVDLNGRGHARTIQDGLDALPAEGGVVLVREGKYDITTTITIPDKPVRIVGAVQPRGIFGAIDNVGVEVNCGSNVISIFTLATSTLFSRITIENMRIKSDDSTPNGIEAFALGTGAFGMLTVRNCRIENVEKVFDMTGGVGQAQVWLEDSTVLLTSLAGSKYIDATGGTDFTVRNCIMTVSNMSSVNNVFSTNIDLSIHDSSIEIGGNADQQITTCFGFNTTFTSDGGSALLFPNNGGQFVNCTFTELGVKSGSANGLEFYGGTFNNGAADARGIHFLSGARGGAWGVVFETTYTSEEIKIESTAGIIIANCHVGSNGRLKILESSANNVVYSGNDNDMQLTVAGADSFVDGVNTKAISATDTMDNTDDVWLVDASGAARTVNLPTAASRKFRKYTIKKTDATGNLVTIDGNSSETIDGELTHDLTTQYESVTIVSDGSNWHII
jgi:hypothetical protein